MTGSTSAKVGADVQSAGFSRGAHFGGGGGVVAVVAVVAVVTGAIGGDAVAVGATGVGPFAASPPQAAKVSDAETAAEDTKSDADAEKNDRVTARTYRRPRSTGKPR